MMTISQLFNFILNVGLLVAGLKAITKIPFFTTKLNENKIKGKRFAKLGLICFFGARCLSVLISIFTGVTRIYFSSYNFYTIIGLVGWVGLGFLIYSAILFYKGSKSDLADEKVEKENIKKPTFTANEEISQKAQYAYANFKNEYEQGAIVIDEIAEAKMFAKAVELQLLKAPASAVFCSMEEMNVLPIGEHTYSVSGYVDSQNNYGAMLRNQFNLTVFKDENGIWKNANRFISTAASVNSSIISSTILWWILGIIGTLITFAISYAFISSKF